MCGDKNDGVKRLAYLAELFRQLQTTSLRNCGRALSILNMQPEMNQSELGYLLDMHSEPLLALLAAMETRGYIARATSGEGCQSATIRLTPEGAQAAAKRGEIQCADGGVFAAFTAEEQKAFFKYLDRTIVELERRLAGAGSTPDALGGGASNLDGRDARACLTGHKAGEPATPVGKEKPRFAHLRSPAQDEKQ